MSEYLDRLEQRILAREDKLATHNHIVEDDEESEELIEDFNHILEENEQLLEANAILHAKVAALRAENQRLADICEEQDIVIDDLKQAGDRLAVAFSAHLSHNA